MMIPTPTRNLGVAATPRELHEVAVHAAQREYDRVRAVRRHYANELQALLSGSRPAVVEDAALVRQDVADFILRRLGKLDQRIVEAETKLIDLGAL